jgi:ribulose-phosphate 3-epimerase
LQYAIEIDGGVSLENLGDIVRAGTDWLVAGSSVFHSVNPGDTVREMQRLAKGATAVAV